MRAFGGIALGLVLVISLLVALSASAHAKPVAGRRLGVGLVVGEPTAVTGYYSLAEIFAVDVALGVVSPGQRDLAGHADGLIVLGPRVRTNVTAAFYFGVGLFFIRFYDDLFAGARIPIGVALYVPEARLSLYAEGALELLRWQPYDTPRREEFQGAIGVRFFF